MSIATTVPPAYYAPLNSSRRASEPLSDQEVWLDETLEGTEAADWRNQHDVALSDVRRLVTFESPRAAHRPTPVMTPEQAALSEALRQTYALRLLPVGRNGYDSLPPSPASVSHALRWLEAQWRQCQTEGIRWYAPNVTADAEGEVVFEWWAGDRSLIVYVEGDSAEFHRSLDGAGPTRHTHGEAPLGETQVDLMRWFSE